jgi:CubicO group peptidase (beta-lactamase class C family)
MPGIRPTQGRVSSLLIRRGDTTLVEQRHGCGPQDLFFTFSTTKPITALAVHLLVERGQLDLDRPIAAHWPAYAAHGKGHITPRHVLTHRAGVPFSTGTPIGDVLALTNWDHSVRLAARARPRWPVDQVQAYHYVSFGFILGELVRRVDGRSLDQFVAEEFFAPLGLTDSYLALPPELFERAVPLTGSLVDWPTCVFLNRRAARQALIPAASLHTTARDLARFYRLLLDGGRTPDGTVILSPDTIASALQAAPGEYDQVLHFRARFAVGFQMGLPGGISGLGSHASDRTFGHNGSNVCTAWADPTRDLIFVYLTNIAGPLWARRKYMSEMCNAALAAADAT